MPNTIKTPPQAERILCVRVSPSVWKRVEPETPQSPAYVYEHLARDLMSKYLSPALTVNRITRKIDWVKGVLRITVFYDSRSKAEYLIPNK